MSVEKKHVILIGMPGSGKSAVGAMAAGKLGRPFVDSDRVIEARQGKTLHEIIEQEQNAGFLRIEEAVNLTLGLEEQPTVFATGGSAIYSEKAMAHFKTIGRVVYLRVPYEEIRRRLGDFALRGVIVPQGWTLRDLYDQRIRICEGYADLIVDQHPGETLEQAAQALCRAIRETA